MSTIQIHVFISHAWAYSADYDTLANWIFEKKWSVGQASLDLRNYSVPRHDPIHNADNDLQLKRAIFNQMAMSHVIVIPMGMYAAHSRWIQKEIEGANQYRKPILAVVPRGSLRVPEIVSNNADLEVGWNSDSVVDGIWKLYNL